MTDTQNNNHKEVLSTSGNSKESLFVLISIIGILALTSLLLLLRQPSAAVSERLPAAITNMMTQLSNAQEEIKLLQQIEVLPAKPSLADLRAEQLPPFSNAAFIETMPGCIQIELDDYLLKFQQQDTAQNTVQNTTQAQWLITWAKHTPEHGHQHEQSSHDQQHACDAISRP